MSFLKNLWDILVLERSEHCSSVAMSRRSLGGLPALVVRWPPVPVRWRFEGWWRQRSYCCRTWKRPWCFVLASWPTATTDGTWRCSSQSWMLITGRSASTVIIRHPHGKIIFKQKNIGWFRCFPQISIEYIVMYMTYMMIIYTIELLSMCMCVCIHLYIYRRIFSDSANT